MSGPTVRPRRAIAELPAYVPGARSEHGTAFKLSSNEVPFPPLASVRRAVARAAADLNRYPDMFATELAAAVAARHRVAEDQVLLGCGSVAVLEHLLQAFCDPGDEVVYAWRSFEAYPIAVGLQGATSLRVEVDPLGRHDLPAMLAAVGERTRVLLLCSPNNPTGPALMRAEVERLLAAVPDHVLVVLDEAYVEFVRDPDAADGLGLLPQFPNLVVLRTFSKAYGLAGLRVGYGIGHPDLIRAIRTAATPFGVNHLAQVAALASLAAEAELMARVEAVVAERDRVLTGLRAQGWQVPDAQGNFVWLAAGARTPDLVADAARHGLLLRGFPEGLRITVGEAAANDRLLAVAGSWR